MRRTPHVHTTLQGRLMCRDCPTWRPTTPENIGPEDMFPNGVFVFGSNTAGVHGSGAAKFAKLWFGAKQGVGEGLVENSYAFPTLNADSHGGLKLVKRSIAEISTSVSTFEACVQQHPELTFWLTKVGCGLAGYAGEWMKSWFITMEFQNLIKPEGWSYDHQKRSI